MAERLRRVVRENALSLIFLGLFLAALVGQAMAGHDAYNEDQLDHNGHTVSFWAYITSSAFGRAVMENWQSEYLQFTLFLMLTVWFVQRGSPESKHPGEEGLETDKEQRVKSGAVKDSPRWAKTGGWRTWLFSNSLLLLMLVLWLGSWLAQSLTGWTQFNQDAADHGGQGLTWWHYLGTSHFWEETLQNWQSEFLAVGSFVIFAVFLRQRGSPESKPVGAPHEATSIEG